MLDDNKDIPLYMIGIVAQMLEIHPQTLRLYEKEGLVVPERSKGNTRLYSGRDVERLKLIIHLTRDMGVNLAGIDIILRMRDQLDQMQREMKEMMLYMKDRLQESKFVDKKDSGRERKKVVRVKVEKGG